MGDRRSARLRVRGGGGGAVDYAEIFGAVPSAASIPLLDLPSPAISGAGAGEAAAEDAGIDYAEVFGAGDGDGEGFGAFYEDLVAEKKREEEEEKEEDEEEGVSSNRRNLKGTCFDQDATGVSPSPNLVCDSPSNPKKNEVNFGREQGKKQLSLFPSTVKSGDFSKTSKKGGKEVKETPPSSKQSHEATTNMDVKPKSESEGFFQKPKGSYQFQNCGSAFKYKKAHRKAATKSPSDSTDAAAASAALKEAMEQAEARLRSAKEMRESKGNLFKSSAKLGPNDVICKERRENKAKCEGTSLSKKLIHAAAVKKPEIREASTLTNEEKETGIEVNPFQSSYNSVETSGRKEAGEEISQLVNDANDAEEVFKCSEKEGNMKEAKAKSKNGEEEEEEEETESNHRGTQEMIGAKEKSELKSFSGSSQVITESNGETEKSEKTEKITNAVMNASRKEEINKIIDEVKEVRIPEEEKISLETSPRVVDLGHNKNKKEDSVNFSIIKMKADSKFEASKEAFKLGTSSIPSSVADESVKMKEVRKSGVQGKNNEEERVPQELFLRETNEKSKAVEKTVHRKENENIRKPANLSYFTEKTEYEIKETDQKLEPEEPKKFERTQCAHNKGIIGGKEIPQLESFTKKSQVIDELPSKYQRDGNSYSYNETCEWCPDAKKYTNTVEEEMKGLSDTFPKVSMRVKDKISIELSPEVDVHGQDKNNIEGSFDLTTRVKTELEPDSRMNSNKTCQDSEETYEPDDFYARKEEKKSLASKKDNECAKCVEELDAIPGPPVLDASMKMKVHINSEEEDTEDTNNEENRVSEESILYEAEKKTVAARGTSHCGEKEKIKAPANLLLYFAEKDSCIVKEIDQKGELKKEPNKVESVQYAHSQGKSEEEKRPEAAEETIEDTENKNRLGSAKEDSQIDYAEKWVAVTKLLRQCSEKNHKTIFEKEKTMDRMRKDEENGRKDVQKEDASGKGGVAEKNIDKEKLLQRKLEEKEREIERQKDNLAVERVIYGAHERAVAKDRERATKVAADKAIAESRQRTLAEAREKAAKASSEKASEGAKVRAAVARATAEALERAARKAALEARQCKERSMNSSRNHRAKDNEAQGRFKANYTDINQRSMKPDDFSKDAVSRNINQRHSRSNNHGSDGASALRFKARIERHQRIAERAAKALADKNMRDMLAQREQEERNRLADYLDTEVRRWATGKEGNLRALLSTLQYILGPDSGWQPISLTDLITATALKKAYRKATLCVHPDKLQQRGASVPQKYKCEKVFDLLKDAWNRFNSELR